MFGGICDMICVDSLVMSAGFYPHHLSTAWDLGKPSLASFFMTKEFEPSQRSRNLNSFVHIFSSSICFYASDGRGMGWHWSRHVKTGTLGREHKKW